MLEICSMCTYKNAAKQKTKIEKEPANKKKTKNIYLLRNCVFVCIIFSDGIERRMTKFNVAEKTEF